LHSSLEAGRRIISSENMNPSCDSPLKVWQFLLPEIACLKQEEFRVIVLNNKNHVIRITRTSIGTLTEAIVHPREIFLDAIRESGSSVILVHNHPSGVLTPSREDIEITKRINEAGKIIGIRLLDHLIVSELSYLSMKEDGYLS
jgi:DNA repair protein RadC